MPDSDHRFGKLIHSEEDWRCPIGQAEELYKTNCLMCHGKNGMGNGDAFFPRLQGQHHAYLVRQMLWIRDGFRKNGNALMAEKLQPMSDAQISVLADYISRMPSPADTDQ